MRGNTSVIYKFGCECMRILPSMVVVSDPMTILTQLTACERLALKQNYKCLVCLFKYSQCEKTLP